jgi:hypothetical protein
MIADNMRRVNLLCKMSEVGLKGFKLVGGTAWQKMTYSRIKELLLLSGEIGRHSGQLLDARTVTDDSVSDGLQDGPPDIQIAATMRTMEIQTLDQTKSYFHLTEAMPVLRCRLTTLEPISEHLHDRLAGSKRRPSEQRTADRSIMHGTDRSDINKMADLTTIVDLRMITSLNKMTDIFRRNRSVAKRSIVRSTKARMGWTARRKTVTNSRA